MFKEEMENNRLRQNGVDQLLGPKKNTTRNKDMKDFRNDFFKTVDQGHNMIADSNSIK